MSKTRLSHLFYTISLILIIQIVSTSCSRKSYPEASKHEKKTAPVTHNKPIKTNNRALQRFLDQGHGKKLATGNLKADDLIQAARRYMGVKHCMGGSSKRCMDCSGLVMRAFEDNGITFPHNSEAQARYGKIILDKYKLKRGDLVYFINTYNTSKYITHTGICIGNNQFIHTSSSKGVMISSLDNSYWKTKFIFGTEVF